MTRAIRLLAPWAKHLLAILLMIAPATFVFAQPDDKTAGDDERDPLLKHWQWMFEVRLPEKMDGPLVAVNLTPEVFGKVRMAGRRFDKDKFDPDRKDFGELPDLRLTDAKGKRVPFIVRTMNDTFRRADVFIRRTFNAAPSLKSRTYQASYELDNVQAPGHNEIEIHTTRNGNFRRKVEVFGDDNERFDNPKSILGKGKYVVYYDVDGKIVDVHKFRYDFMRYRFLQVRLHADDPTVDEEVPTITSIKVLQIIEVPGESVTEQASLDGPQQTRGEGGPGTSWFVLLQDRMPVDKLTFEVAGEPSERPMRIEVAEQNQAPFPIGIIEKNWRKPERGPNDPIPAKDDKGPMGIGGPRNDLEVRFFEVIARRLRFVVTDFANEPLRITNVKSTRWVRRLIFEKPDEAKYTFPLRLYAGHKDISPPGYHDFAKTVPANLKPVPPLGTLDKAQENPSYEPPPQTLSERRPDLVYWILTPACVVLLAILGLLAWQAIRRHDAKEAAPTT